MDIAASCPAGHNRLSTLGRFQRGITLADPPPARVDPDESVEGRVPLEIGPFASQGDLLRLAALLESAVGVGRIDLISADLPTGLFVVHAASASSVAVAVAELQDFRVSTMVFGNGVSARIHESPTRALQIFSSRWRLFDSIQGWPLALLIIIPLWLAVTAAMLAATGRQDVTTRILSAVSPWSASGPARPPFVRPTAGPSVLAQPQPQPPPTVPVVGPTARPTVTATPAVTATPIATPTPTLVPILRERFRGTFSGTMGSMTAVNGCTWQLPFDAEINLALERQADGGIRGSAAVVATVSYVVAGTPSGTVCNPATVSAEASGFAGRVGSGVTASASGERELEVTFSGTLSGDQAAGDIVFQRRFNTTSPFGNTSDLLSTTISGVRLTRS